MKAKTYYEDMSMSKDAIYDQLVSEYGEQFTAEQAKYAIEHLDQRIIIIQTSIIVFEKDNDNSLTVGLW